MRTQLPSALLATALACTYFAVPAQAQAPRTFVSAAGNDSNPCSFAAPCRHFQAAVNATMPAVKSMRLTRLATARSLSPRPSPSMAKAGPTLHRRPTERQLPSLPSAATSIYAAYRLMG